MPSVYVVDQSQYTNYDWHKELTEIEALNPDLVLCFCLEEFDYNYIFSKLFPKLSEWASKNKRQVKLLLSCENNLRIVPNITIEKTFGYYLYALQSANRYATFLANEKVKEYYKHVSKVYTSYNNNPKFERALLVDELAKRNLLHHGIVTFIHPEDIFASHTNEPFPGWKYHDGSKLVDEPDFKLNSKPEYFCDMLPRSYLSGFIDIVSESQVSPNRFFPSEKTTKPLITMKPFLVLANRHYHKYLYDEFGIEMYDELFDYSFDKEPDVKKRVLAIVDNVENIVHNCNGDFTNIYEQLLPKLQRNKEKFFEYGDNKSKMIIKSVMRVLEYNYEVYGSDAGIFKLNQVIAYYRKKGWLPDSYRDY